MKKELADYLLGLEKQIQIEDRIADKYELNIEYPMNFRLILMSEEDIDQSLLIDVKESEKRALKISLHHQDDATQNGVLRVDYFSRHKNPDEINEFVPEVFHEFAGIYLDDYDGHIHYVIDGYKPLAWAIPLEVDHFPVKTLKGRDEYANVLKAFFKRINIKTPITFTTQMRTL